MKLEMLIVVIFSILFLSSNAFRSVKPIFTLKPVLRKPGTFPVLRYDRNQRSSITVLYITNWFDDSLPNILGINPIEAAILFGGLYYLYGPETLYDYAREAGKAFATYAPLVQRASLDIFDEFKEFIEEDKQRDMLKKRGINIDNVPRRTTNILERASQAFEAYSKMSEKTSNDSELQRALRKDDGEAVDSDASATFTIDIEEEGVVKKKVKRRKKKDILIAKNIDVDKVIRDAETEGDGTELTKNLKVVQDRLSELTKARERIDDDYANRFNSIGGSYNQGNMPQYNEYGFPNAQEPGLLGSTDKIDDEWPSPPSPPFTQLNPMQAVQSARVDDYSIGSTTDDLAIAGARPATITASPYTGTDSQVALTPAASAPAMSKFQQQLSGKWNEEVMKKNQGFDSTMDYGGFGGYDSYDGGSSLLNPAPLPTYPNAIGVEGLQSAESAASELMTGIGGGGSLGAEVGLDDPSRAATADPFLQQSQWGSFSPTAQRQQSEFDCGLSAQGPSGVVSSPVNDIPEEISSWDVADGTGLVAPNNPSGYIGVAVSNGIAASSPYATLPSQPTPQNLTVFSTVPRGMQVDGLGQELGAIGGSRSGSGVSSGLSPEATLELLRELDRDYMALRRRVLNVLEVAQGQASAQTQAQAQAQASSQGQSNAQRGEMQMGDDAANIERVLSGSSATGDES